MMSLTPEAVGHPTTETGKVAYGSDPEYKGERHVQTETRFVQVSNIASLERALPAEKTLPWPSQ